MGRKKALNAAVWPVGQPRILAIWLLEVWHAAKQQLPGTADAEPLANDTHTHVHTHIHTSAHAHTHTHTHTRARTHTHTHTHTHAHAHTHTRAHAHTHTNTHTRTQAQGSLHSCQGERAIAGLKNVLSDPHKSIKSPDLHPHDAKPKQKNPKLLPRK